MRAFWMAVLGGGLLGACGGGGDSNPLPTPLTITATNRVGVASATAAAVASLLGAGSGVTASDGSGASPASAQTGATRQAGTSFAAAARRLAGALGGDAAAARKRVASAPVRALAIASETTPCTAGGQVIVSFTDADNNGAPSIGDTLTLTFAQCYETADDSIDGSMSISLSRFDMVNGLVSFDGSMSLQQLSIVAGARSAGLAGGLAMTYTEDSTTQSRIALVVGSAGLTAGAIAPGFAETVTYEPDFSLSETDTFDATTGALDHSVADLRGGFRAASIGGRVLLEPLAPIAQYAVDAYPILGTLRVVGNASALRLRVIDTTQVEVDLDANLDGTYESGGPVAWTALLPG